MTKNIYKMSSNRLIYDKCEYDQRNQTNNNMLGHIIDEKRYRNKKNCTFKSAKIDQFIGSRVDIESQLKNLDQTFSLCSSKKKKPCKSKNDKNCHKGETANPFICERNLQVCQLPGNK